MCPWWQISRLERIGGTFEGRWARTCDGCFLRRCFDVDAGRPIYRREIHGSLTCVRAEVFIIEPMVTRPKRIAVYPMSLSDAIAALLRRNPRSRQWNANSKQQLNPACIRSESGPIRPNRARLGELG